MKLKFKKHFYGDSVSEYEIVAPDDIVFTYVKEDIGHGLHKGYGHYLGGSKTLIEQKGLYCHIYKDFPDVYLYAFNDVIFESDINIITPEEFTNRFELDNCYIFHYTQDRIETNNKSGAYEDILEGNYKIIPGKLISISKILKVRSQNLIDTMSCSVNSYINFDDTEVKMIYLNIGTNLHSLIEDSFCKTVIRKNADEEFTEVLNQVLSIVNKSTI